MVVKTGKEYVCCLLKQISAYHRVFETVRYENDKYKCVYDAMKNQCNAFAAVIYTTTRLTSWRRWLAASNCSVSKYF